MATGRGPRRRRSPARAATSGATCSARSARRALRDLPAGRPEGLRAAAPDALQLPPGVAGRGRRSAFPVGAGAGRACTRSARSRRAIHSLPGWSVSPWARIEQNTTSAAMLKIRSPLGDRLRQDEQRERHRRHALGPEPGHERLRRRVGRACRRARSRSRPAARPAACTTTIATAAQPSSNRPLNVSSDPNTTNTPSLTISTMSSRARREVVRACRAGGCRARCRARTRR